MTITSRQHPLVRRFRDAARGGDDQPLLLDGWHLLREAVGVGLAVESSPCAGDPPDAADATLARPALGATRRRRRGACPPTVMKATEPGAHAVGRRGARPRRPRRAARARLAPAPALVVVAVDVQDPGNVGALVRAAEAGGATGVIVAGASADPWAGRRCARRWAARSGCPCRARAPTARRVRRACRRAVSARGGRAARRHAAARRGPSRPDRAAARRRRRRACRAALVDAADCAVTHSDAAAGRVAERRRRRRRCSSTRHGASGRASGRRAIDGGAFGWPLSSTTPAQRARPADGAARRADAPADARRDRRPGGAPRARPAAARGDRARPAAVDHPLGAARHRQDHARARHRRADRRPSSSPSAPCSPASRRSRT